MYGWLIREETERLRTIDNGDEYVAIRVDSSPTDATARTRNTGAERIPAATLQPLLADAPPTPPTSPPRRRNDPHICSFPPRKIHWGYLINRHPPHYWVRALDDFRSGMNFDQIAYKEGIRPSTARSYTFRALLHADIPGDALDRNDFCRLLGEMSGARKDKVYYDAMGLWGERLLIDPLSAEREMMLHPGAGNGDDEDGEEAQVDEHGLSQCE